MNKQSKEKTRFIVTVFFVCIFIIYLLSGHYTCYTKALTGMPCPGCGMTRACLALLHGNIREAFFYHPLFLLPILIGILLLFQHYTKRRIPRLVWILILILFLGVYAIRLYLYFPDTAPMNFNNQAVLPRLLRLPGFFHALFRNII